MNRSGSVRKASIERMLASLFGLLLMAGAMPPARAQQPAPVRSRSPGLFGSAQPLVLAIRAPWRDITRNKKEQAAYPATLEYVDASGSRQVVPLTVERRGLTRQRVCSFPPIKLRFAKGAARGTVFHGSRSIKMVTHCADGERWEQYYVKEMLAYRFYNLMTDRSFRVRPVLMTYLDSQDRSADGPHFAFLIEDDATLAKRTGLRKVPVARPALDQFEPLESSRFALFQYLIGNTDWAVLSGPSNDRCCHNSVLIGAAAKDSLYAVPYDFDSSGLVNAHYASPSATLSTASVTERVFRGFCVNNATLESTRREYLQRESQINDLVRNESRLTPRVREAAQAYLAKFFEILRDQERFARNVTAKCRK